MIDLGCDDSFGVKALIDYCYLSDYDLPEDPIEATPLTFHATMYSMAEKYEIRALKLLAKEKFERALKHTRNWSYDGLFDAIPLIYSATPEQDRGLRDLVVAAANANARTLKHNEEFQEVLKEVNDFTLDLLGVVWKAEDDIDKAGARSPATVVAGVGLFRFRCDACGLICICSAAVAGTTRTCKCGQQVTIQ